MDTGATLTAAVAIERRVEPTRSLAGQSDEIARTCAAMADRFARGGRLLAVGVGSCANDAAHIAVEFMHPVIVGKRALPALCMRSHVTAAVHVLAREDDIVVGLALGDDVNELAAVLAIAQARGALTVALVASAGGAVPADHVLVVGADDPRIATELQVTCYHLLWELTHVYLERSAPPLSVVS